MSYELAPFPSELRAEVRRLVSARFERQAPAVSFEAWSEAGRHFELASGEVLDEAGLDPLAAADLAQATRDDLWGLGPLQPLVGQAKMFRAVGTEAVFVEWPDGRREAVASPFDSEADLVEMVQRLARRHGASERRFDAGAFEVKLRLPGGHRVAAVQAVAGVPRMAVRCHHLSSPAMADLVGLGALPPAAADLVEAAVRANLRILVSGAPGAGKTTFLRAAMAAADPLDVVATVESTYELGLDRATGPDGQLRHRDVLALEEREANLDGHGAVPMVRLVRVARHQDVERLVVGEILGDEVVALLDAFAMGVGGMSTIHASSAEETWRRVAIYAELAPERLPTATTARFFAAAVDFVVHLARRPDGTHLVTAIAEVAGEADGQVLHNTIWRREGEELLPYAAVSPRHGPALAEAGYRPPVPTAVSR